MLKQVWKQHKLAIILGIALLVSNIALIYVRDLSRREFYYLRLELQRADQLQIEWGQLLLELRTWASPARVEQIARQRLQMQLPKSKHLIIIPAQNAQHREVY